MKKKLFLLLSLVLCIVFMTGCSNSDTDEVTIDDETKTIIETSINSTFSTWVTCSFESASTDESLDEEDRNEYKAWQDLKDSLGTLRNQTEVSYDITKEDNTITVNASITAEFDNGKIDFVETFDSEGNPTDIAVNEIQSMGQIMQKALLNTLMGMGTVFCILILISLVISCFGIIGKQQAKKKAEAAKARQQQEAPAVMAPVVEVQENLTDDLELVAVITAAIMASMGEEAPAEGLVVRSIRKRNASQWKNA